MSKLTNSTLDRLKNDGMLFGEIADLLDITIMSMGKYLQRNSPSLAKKPIRALIAKKWGVEVESLIEDNADALV